MESYNNKEDNSDIYLVILHICPSPSVGGEILPSNASLLTAPYLLIIVVAVAGTVGILYKKRTP